MIIKEEISNANYKGHFLHPTANGRQDVLALKQQLADALGENGPLYWDAQEFDFYANLYLSRQNAYLHNAFILSTVHNAQTNTPPPSKHRLVGWAKRKRGKDGNVMALGKADRERLKALVKSGDKNKLKPYVDKLLGTRISRPPILPFALDHLPPNYSQEYSKGLMAPLCIDLKELPSPETLHSRMTSIALENGLLGGIGEDVVNIMLFAAENYIKSSITSAISKRRVNKCIGVQMIREIDEDENEYEVKNGMDTEEEPSINLRDLAFAYHITPFVLVENSLNAEKLTALLNDSEDEMIVDNLSDSSSEEDYEL
ncbi:unnamed protein product [Mucor hiemalis]